MKSTAKSPDDYLAALPSERREVLERIRAVIVKNLDVGFEEGMQYGMIGYYVPHRIYPAGYHCDPREPLPFASLASQKNHMAIYLMCIHGSEEHSKWFREAWLATGRKIDMGKACVRFKRIEDVALDVLGEAIRRVPTQAFITHYEAALKKTKE